MNNEEMFNSIAEGLKTALDNKAKKDKLEKTAEWYDKKIKSLRDAGFEDTANDWEKLKKASLEKLAEKDY